MENRSQPSHTRYDVDMVSDYPLIYKGKVRDSFAINQELMLIVASDRLSAFDVVLPDAIPGKGEILTQISNFWFGRTEDITANHLTGRNIREFITDSDTARSLERRSVVVRRLEPLPVEAIVRGYLIGSGWNDYRSSGAISGIQLPAGLKQAQQLPGVIFTPSTKAAAGDHDINIGFDAMVAEVGGDLAREIRRISIALYERAVQHASARDIIIADTKFEFGLDQAGKLLLMDELLTPDSSRFWPSDAYRPGMSPPSYDKQYVRDYLETLAWNKRPPGPALPADVIAATAEKYAEAERLLTGPPRHRVA